MIGELNVGGVFVPALLIVAIAAFVLSLLVRRALRHYRIYRFVWHAGLFDVAVFVLLTWVLSMITLGLDRYGFA